MMLKVEQSKEPSPELRLSSIKGAGGLSRSRRREPPAQQAACSDSPTVRSGTQAGITEAFLSSSRDQGPPVAQIDDSSPLFRLRKQI